VPKRIIWGRNKLLSCWSTIICNNFFSFLYSQPTHEYKFWIYLICWDLTRCFCPLKQALTWVYCHYGYICIIPAILQFFFFQFTVLVSFFIIPLLNYNLPFNNLFLFFIIFSLLCKIPCKLHMTYIYIYILNFVVLGVELRILCLLGRLSVSGAIPQPFLLQVFFE
jgi:hypothetical protein